MLKNFSATSIYSGTSYLLWLFEKSLVTKSCRPTVTMGNIIKEKIKNSCFIVWDFFIIMYDNQYLPNSYLKVFLWSTGHSSKVKLVSNCTS